jgi:hypothetical protein
MASERRAYLWQGVSQAGGLVEMWLVREEGSGHDLFTAIGFFARWRCERWARQHGYTLEVEPHE